MTALAYIIIGACLFAFFGRYLRVAASVGAVLISLLIAYRVVTALIPSLENTPAALGSGALWLVLMLAGGGAWFYMLGWQARVSKTASEEHKRTDEKAARDRKVI